MHGRRQRDVRTGISATGLTGDVSLLKRDSKGQPVRLDTRARRLERTVAQPLATPWRAATRL
jgi:hypothetical protein